MLIVGARSGGTAEGTVRALCPAPSTPRTSVLGHAGNIRQIISPTPYRRKCARQPGAVQITESDAELEQPRDRIAEYALTVSSELAVAGRCRIRCSGAVSRAVWHCAEPAWLKSQPSHEAGGPAYLGHAGVHLSGVRFLGGLGF